MQSSSWYSTLNANTATLAALCVRAAWLSLWWEVFMALAVKCWVVWYRDGHALPGCTHDTHTLCANDSVFHVLDGVMTGWQRFAWWCKRLILECCVQCAVKQSNSYLSVYNHSYIAWLMGYLADSFIVISSCICHQRSSVIQSACLSLLLLLLCNGLKRNISSK